MNHDTQTSKITILERALSVARRFEAAGWEPTLIDVGEIVLKRDGRTLSVPALDEKKWQLLESSMALALRFEAAGWYSTLVDVGQLIFERGALTLSAQALQSGRWQIRVVANYSEIDIDAWTKFAASLPAGQLGEAV